MRVVGAVILSLAGLTSVCCPGALSWTEPIVLGPGDGEVWIARYDEEEIVCAWDLAPIIHEVTPGPVDEGSVRPI